MRIAILVVVASILLVGRSKLAETSTANHLSNKILALANEFLTVWREFVTVASGITAVTGIGTYGDPRDVSLPRRPLNPDGSSYRDPVSRAAYSLPCADELGGRMLHPLHVPKLQRRRS